MQKAIKTSVLGVLALSGILLGYLTVMLPEIVLGQIPDPGVPGPYEVTRDDYTLDEIEITGPRRLGMGDLTATVEVVGSVHAPSDLSKGPFPVAVFLHGRFCTCRIISCLRWPCPENPYWSYKGYDYISDILASHGYIVISVSANGINSVDNDWRDFGGNERAQLVLHHLDKWTEFNTVGGDPFGDRFIGKLDLNNIGLMGHSRGGEGVVRTWFCNQNPAACNIERDITYNIKAVHALAPINFFRTRINNVPFSTLLPYCDGDVFPLNGEQYYDDSRYEVAGDTGSKHHVLVMGANHDWYNTIWEGNDDWTAFRDPTRRDPYCVPTSPTSGRLTRLEQRTTSVAYIAGFMRLHLGGETSLLPLFTGDAAPPPSIGSAEVHHEFHPEDSPSARLDVDRVVSDESLSTNTLGGSVSQTGLNPFITCVGGFACNFGPVTVHPSRMLRIGWDDASAQYQSEIPDTYRDVSQYNYLSFRASVKFNDSRNPEGEPQNFSVVLIDGGGQPVSAAVNDYSSALYFPPGGDLAQKIVLNSVRIPLNAFSGINFTDVRSIGFNYDQNSEGSVFINDIMFVQ